MNFVSRESRSRQREAGYSLIEVLVSLGLMTGVMVSVCSMFVMGGTFVKSGKQLTQATVLAQGMMEDISRLSYRGLYENLQVTLDPNATSVVSDTRVPGDKADDLWGPEIRSTLHKGYAVVTATPLGGTVTPTTLATGEGLRIEIELGWTELRRDRTVEFVHVRF